MVLWKYCRKFLMTSGITWYVCWCSYWRSYARSALGSPANTLLIALVYSLVCVKNMQSIQKLYWDDKKRNITNVLINIDTQIKKVIQLIINNANVLTGVIVILINGNGRGVNVIRVILLKKRESLHYTVWYIHMHIDIFTLRCRLTFVINKGDENEVFLSWCSTD